jgi:tetratricopeptide (TPR) repeat protein
MSSISQTIRGALLISALSLWPAARFSQTKETGRFSPPEPQQEAPPPVQREKGSEPGEGTKNELRARSAQVSDRLRAAEELMSQSREEEALAEYRRAIELAAGRPAERRLARFAYAQALSKLGCPAEAAPLYEAVIRSSRGRDPVASFNLGNACAAAGENQRAAAAYRQAIEQRFGHYARASNNLGLVLVRLGRYDEAREAYLRAIAEERGSYADAHYNLARLYLLRGELKRTEEHLTSALHLDPAHEDAATLQAELAASRDAHRRDAESVITDPSRAARRIAGTISSSEAEPGATRTVAVNPAAFRLLQQAREARDRGDLERASSLYQSSLRAEGRPVNPIEWELASVWSGQDRAREAAAAYQRILARAADRYPMAYYNLGRALMKEGKYAASSRRVASGAYGSPGRPPRLFGPQRGARRQRGSGWRHRGPAQIRGDAPQTQRRASGAGLVRAQAGQPAGAKKRPLAAAAGAAHLL